jgi:hypothetical protein
MLGNYREAAQVVASRVVLKSTELVISSNITIIIHLSVTTATEELYSGIKVLSHIIIIICRIRSNFANKTEMKFPPL